MSRLLWGRFLLLVLALSAFFLGWLTVLATILAFWLFVQHKAQGLITFHLVGPQVHSVVADADSNLSHEQGCCCF